MFTGLRHARSIFRLSPTIFLWAIISISVLTLIYSTSLLVIPADGAKKTYTCAFISGGTNHAPATIVGKDNKGDVIQGTPGDDVIVGLGGNDIIYGNGGNDIICGGDGADQIFGGDGNDKLWGDADNDVIEGNDGNDVIIDCCGSSQGAYRIWQ